MAEIKTDLADVSQMTTTTTTGKKKEKEKKKKREAVEFESTAMEQGQTHQRQTVEIPPSYKALKQGQKNVSVCFGFNDFLFIWGAPLSPFCPLPNSPHITPRARGPDVGESAQGGTSFLQP